MVKVQGTCDPRFAKVKSVFQSYLDSGEELGASISVNLDGKEVVDLWGGYADEARTRPWEKDTITCVWSSSKTICALAALVCIDRGLLDPNEKVCKYWPEFAANGKEGVEVRHFLSHASGVSGWEEAVTIEDVCDVEKSTKLLEQQAPWWEPGTASGYHGLTMGHLIGELIRRVTGKPMQQFIAEELARPLTADFQLGVPEKEWHRVADIIPPPQAQENMEGIALDTNSLMFKSMGKNPGMDADWANQPVWRGSVVGAANGYSNARALVRLLSVISLENPSFLSAKTLDRIFSTEQEGEKDLVIPMKVRLGLGFGLPAEGSIMADLPPGRAATWGGWGGSRVIADADRRMTFGYVMNKMDAAGLGQTNENGKGGMGNSRTSAYIATVYEALGIVA
ncbi:beta-lactamase [Alternaria rosae]|uniref:beta-lactamase n=1 Tax=Alternaria rosae TaxID=1187941 RepID=UPI001E8E70C9|nr:beta-lactamase [Alternaria rosae]KAH6882909.1 beta-lactamase [Alternaria rosae]